MTVAADQTIGPRLARERKLAGLSQHELAARSHFSPSLVSQVERGVAPASPGLIAACARVLGVSAAYLQAQPYTPSDREGHQVHAVIPGIRRELAAYAVPPADISVRPLPELEAAVAEASRMRHSVDLAGLGGAIPGLLAELRTATQQLAGSAAERAWLLLGETYYAASQVAYKLGYVDLASLAVERYEWAAAQSGDPLAVLVGVYARAGELINIAEWDSALDYLERGRASISDQIGADGPATLSMWGNLHLKSGLAAARSGRRDIADAHLAEAQQTAERIGADRDDYRLCFGPTNVAIWSVGLAVEAQDGTTAVDRASRIVIPPGTQRERAGHHWIDVARGFLLHGDRSKSLQALQSAYEVSPQQTRYHPQVRETVATLAEADARATDSLAGFARRIGLRV